MIRFFNWFQLYQIHTYISFVYVDNHLYIHDSSIWFIRVENDFCSCMYAEPCHRLPACPFQSLTLWHVCVHIYDSYIHVNNLWYLRMYLYNYTDNHLHCWISVGSYYGLPARLSRLHTYMLMYIYMVRQNMLIIFY